MPSLTVNFSLDHGVRIRDALDATYRFEDENGDPRPATMTDLEWFVKKAIRDLVQKQERRQAAAAARASVPPVDIT